ncbi:MAG: ATP-binding cassette domain-containing protein [Bacilli bacterium]|nr:ATP-binding cassette domain-containing protein [Bacilli bacterium]
MLKVDGVTKYYGDNKAVDNLSFSVGKGEIFGLLGVNGAGKTTTFRMIMNLITPNSGKITFNNKKIDYNVTDKIGFLTEERSLLTKLTVKEQILFYGALKSLDEKTILKRLDKLLKEFEIEEYKDRKINTLSKGNQQKVQFISAIINEPKLLILDEPFSGLDPINIELFKKVILRLKEKGTSIIFSSHRMDHVELFCEKLVILVKGKSVLNGYLKDIKDDYKIKKVLIKGDVKISELKKINGVINAGIKNDEYVVKIKDKSYVKDIYKYLKTKDNITKYVIEESSLEEIFISKVGEAYGK